MIKSCKHKGLEKFFTTGSTAGIRKKHEVRLNDQLSALHTACKISDMNVPGWKLHSLKGDRQDLHSISVSGNWRLTFRFEDGDAYIVNYEDYH